MTTNISANVIIRHYGTCYPAESACRQAGNDVKTGLKDGSEMSLMSIARYPILPLMNFLLIDLVICD